VWLVDPGVTQDKADQVVAGYLGRLEANVQVRYFAGYGALVRAEQELREDTSRVVAVIGSLNHSFYQIRLADMRSDFELIGSLQQSFYQPLRLVRGAAVGNPNVHVVRAYYNGFEHVVQDLTYLEFRQDHRREFAWALAREDVYREGVATPQRWDEELAQMEQAYRERQEAEVAAREAQADRPGICLIN
jgi:hypothetical protein